MPRLAPGTLPSHTGCVAPAIPSRETLIPEVSRGNQIACSQGRYPYRTTERVQKGPYVRRMHWVCTEGPRFGTRGPSLCVILPARGTARRDYQHTGKVTGMPTGSSTTTKKAATKKAAPLKRVAPAKKVAASNGAGQSELAKIMADPHQRGEVANAIELRDIMETLVARREAQGLSQREICEKIGVSQPVVSQAEIGNTSLSVNVLQRYARAVGARLALQITR